MKEDKHDIERVLNGDVNAFTSLVRRHQNWVFTIALRITGNREDAEEIAQDVFLKAYRSLKTYKGSSKFSTWLYSIAYNTAISKTRKKKITSSALEDAVVENYTENEIIEDLSVLSKDEQMLYAEKVMDRLSPESYLMVKLFYLNGNSTEEISAITGLSLSNVKVKLHRTRKKMYQLLHEMLEKEKNPMISN